MLDGSSHTVLQREHFPEGQRHRPSGTPSTWTNPAATLRVPTVLQISGNKATGDRSGRWRTEQPDRHHLSGGGACDVPRSRLATSKSMLGVIKVCGGWISAGPCLTVLGKVSASSGQVFLTLWLVFISQSLVHLGRVRRYIPPPSCFHSSFVTEADFPCIPSLLAALAQGCGLFCWEGREK